MTPCLGESAGPINKAFRDVLSAESLPCFPHRLKLIQEVLSRNPLFLGLRTVHRKDPLETLININ